MRIYTERLTTTEYVTIIGDLTHIRSDFLRRTRAVRTRDDPRDKTGTKTTREPPGRRFRVVLKLKKKK